MTSQLSPLQVLVEDATGDEVMLTPKLASFYGRLSLPSPGVRPAVIANFVQSLDGVVTLDAGKSGGGPISGKNDNDRAIMGILRAVSDAVIVGAGTLRSVPDHLWTAGHIYPALAEEFRKLRSSLKKPRHPLNVVVTASGDVDPSFAIFQQEEVPVLVITTPRGADKTSRLSTMAEIAVGQSDQVAPREILDVVSKGTGGGLILSEAGPKLFGQFLDARMIDDVFVTLAPQIAGRDDCEARPGLVSGREFAPSNPLWGSLVGVRRAESYLFLRYALTGTP